MIESSATVMIAGPEDLCADLMRILTEHGIQIRRSDAPVQPETPAICVGGDPTAMSEIFRLLADARLDQMPPVFVDVETGRFHHVDASSMIEDLDEHPLLQLLNRRSEPGVYRLRQRDGIREIMASAKVVMRGPYRPGFDHRAANGAPKSFRKGRHR